MPVPHHSVFYRPDALSATQPTASKHLLMPTKATYNNNNNDDNNNNENIYVTT